MRDDDDTTDDDQLGGNVYQSGIRREGEIEPAEYALAPGVAALQDEVADEWADLDSGRTPRTRHCSRRRFLVFALGGVGISAASFFSGQAFTSAGNEPFYFRHRQPGTRLTQDDLQAIEIARGWVDKPIETLVKAQLSFLWVFQLVEPDETLCRGLKKLCDYAAMHNDENLAARILTTFEVVPTPTGFDADLEAMRELVLRWRTSQERRRR